MFLFYCVFQCEVILSTCLGHLKHAQCVIVFLRGICLSTFSHDALYILVSPESTTGGAPNCKIEKLQDYESPIFFRVLNVFPNAKIGPRSGLWTKFTLNDAVSVNDQITGFKLIRDVHMLPLFDSARF